MAQASQQTRNGKVLTGTVIKNKTDKTVVVEVHRYVRHPKYGKFVRSRKRYQAHDAQNACERGSRVRIQECPRHSKHKTFEVVQ